MLSISIKAQASYIDFIVAIMLFVFTMVLYFSYTANFKQGGRGELDTMLADAKALSSSLILSGYPTNWDNNTVIRIGIAEEQKVNLTKLKYFKKLNYSLTKKNFATIYDYFVFFVNNKGEVLNINGVCGAGYPLINTSYIIRSAYYYQDPDDSFFKNFMNETFKADIYFDDNPSDLNDIDALVSNLSKYSFIVMEHPLLSGGNYNDFKDALNNYSLRGGLFMISGELTTAQGKDLVGVTFFKKSGQSISDRNSTVNNTDQYLSFVVGENIVFAQAYYVENNSSALNFLQIAAFNADNRNAVSKWKYGNGTIYFFSDFDVSYFNGNFVGIVEEAAKGLIEGTCYPINITGINAKNIVKTERYVNHNSKIVKMVVYLWK